MLVSKHSFLKWGYSLICRINPTLVQHLQGTVNYSSSHTEPPKCSDSKIAASIYIEKMEVSSCLLVLQHLEYTRNIDNTLVKCCLKTCLKASFVLYV